MSRAVAADIEACGKALAKAKRPRIHTGIGASDIHIIGKFRDERYGKTLAEKKVTMLADGRGRGQAGAPVRRRRGVLRRRCRPRRSRLICSKCWKRSSKPAPPWSIFPTPPATRFPSNTAALIRAIREKVPNIERATISVHCHDDLGLAVANTLAGVLNGARQVEGTINGIGERAGNAALEEVVMALRTRGDYFGVHTGIDARELYRTSRLVADMLGMPVPPNKAVVGGNAFSHSSGIHVDGFLKERETYEIMRPEDVGISESRVVLTARTGRHGLRDRLEKLGYTLSQEELNQAYQRFLAVADKKQEVFDEDLIAILHDEIHPAARDLPARVSAHLQRHFRDSHRHRAAARSRTKRREGAAIGDGPVDAAVQGDLRSDQNLRQTGALRDPRRNQRHRSLGEVTVQLEEDGRKVVGRGASTDVIEASAKAYIDGLNKLASLGGKVER